MDALVYFIPAPHSLSFDFSQTSLCALSALFAEMDQLRPYGYFHDYLDKTLMPTLEPAVGEVQGLPGGACCTRSPCLLAAGR